MAVGEFTLLLVVLVLLVGGGSDPSRLVVHVVVPASTHACHIR